MIGISNIAAGQLAQLCEQANLKPMVVQNRCFAALGWDKEVREICQAEGIIYQGFSLLTANREVLAHPEIRTIEIGRASCRERGKNQEGTIYSKRRHTRYIGDWSSDVCSSDLARTAL